MSRISERAKQAIHESGVVMKEVGHAGGLIGHSYTQAKCALLLEKAYLLSMEAHDMREHVEENQGSVDNGSFIVAINTSLDKAAELYKQAEEV